MQWRISNTEWDIISLNDQYWNSIIYEKSQKSLTVHVQIILVGIFRKKTFVISKFFLWNNNENVVFYYICDVLYTLITAIYFFDKEHKN